MNQEYEDQSSARDQEIALLHPRWRTYAEGGVSELSHHTDSKLDAEQFVNRPMLRWEKVWMGAIMLILAACTVTGFIWYVHLVWGLVSRMLHR